MWDAFFFNPEAGNKGERVKLSEAVIGAAVAEYFGKANKAGKVVKKGTLITVLSVKLSDGDDDKVSGYETDLNDWFTANKDLFETVGGAGEKHTRVKDLAALMAKYEA
jgi:hypothetical protein